MKKLLKNKSLVYCTILIVLSLIFSFVIFKNGLLRGHDIEFHLSRIKGLSDSIKSGDIKALIHVGLNGYGYANGLFYGNLFIYFPAFLRICGFSLSQSYAIFITLCNIITPLLAFYSMKRVSKSETASFITSLVYTFSPYRICDVVVRAAVGEILAMMIFPILLLGLYEIISGNYKKWWIFSVGFVLLVQAHIISTIVMAVISTIIIIINIEKFINEKRRIKALIFSILYGLLLGLFFILPLIEQYALSDLVVNNLNNASNLANQSIQIERIFLGLSYYGNNAFSPPGIGMIFIIISLFRYKLKTKKTKLLKVCDICLIIGFSLLLIVTPLFPWKELSEYLKFIQFPWRLYLYSSLFLSISSGIIIYLKFDTNIRAVIYIFVYVLLFLIISIPFNLNSIHNYWGIDGMEHIRGYDDYYVANGEYLPFGTDINKLQERGEVITSNNDELIVNFKRIGNKLNIKYKNNYQANTYIEVPLLYYLGYETSEDYKIKNGENNIIRIYLDKESDEFILRYSGTFIQHISYFVSFVTLLISIVIFVRKVDKTKLVNIKNRRKKDVLKIQKKLSKA